METSTACGLGTRVPSRKLPNTSCLQDADRTTFRA